MRVGPQQKLNLPDRIRDGVRPAAELERGVPLANQLAQLPRVLERSGPADMLVAAEHDERRKAVVHGLIRIGEAELQRMLGREKRDDLVAADGVAEVGDEMAQVVFFLRADRAIGHHDAHVVPRQRSNGVVGVDPRVHALCRFELRPGRAELDGHDARRLLAQQRKIRGQTELVIA